MARLRAAWQRAPILISAFAVALALTLFFAGRLVLDAIYWADPRHIDQPIAGWMSPGYVAMSWDIPRDVMLEIIGHEPGEGRPHRLEEIAAERGMSLPALTAEIEAAIQSYREAQP